MLRSLADLSIASATDCEIGRAYVDPLPKLCCPPPGCSPFCRAPSFYWNAARNVSSKHRSRRYHAGRSHKTDERLSRRD